MFKRLAVVSGIELLDKPTTETKMSGKEVTAFEYDTENFVYFRCRAISADVPNGNGDLFSEAELVKAYKSFIGVGMYMDHNSASVDLSVGKVLWAEWVPEGKYIECYCCVDKKLASDLARRIEMGVASTVSMGCMVGEAECSVCNNIAHNAAELCEHMIPGRGIKGKKDVAGKTVHEINRMLQFTELSLVTVPADPTAKIFEVYAAHKAGIITAEELKKYVGEEIAKMIPIAASFTTTESRKTEKVAVTTTNASVPTVNSISKEVKVAAGTESEVVRLVDSQEERMNLSINYQRGPKLESCFFVAKEAGVEFKVSAAEVLPLLVQKAITSGSGEGVATPEQIISELTGKCKSLSAFKAWAKKRKKKNNKAFEKIFDGKDDESAESAEKDGESAEKSKNPFAKKEEKADADVALSAAPAVAPATPAPAPGGQEVIPADPAAQAAPATDLSSRPDLGDEFGDKDVAGLQEIIKDLQQKLEMAHSSLKMAVKTQENVMEKRDNGASNGKPSPAKAPAAIQEIKETKSPSGHIEKGAALKVTAAEKDRAIWSVNDKELEKPAKPGKAAQAAPPDGDVSWDSKEMKSEEIKHDQGSKGSHGSSVKKLYNRLPSGGLGEAPQAVDLKSSVNETLSMKRAIAERDAKIAAMEEKERMAAVVDKIADIVSTLLEKNLITAESEEATIKLLSSKFASAELLDGVNKFVANLSAKQAEAAGPSGVEAIDAGAAPQVFETVNEGEDAITMMSRIWNSNS